MKTSCVGKNTDLICIQTGNPVLVLLIYRFLISLISLPIQELAVAKPIHNKHNLLHLHRRLLINSFFAVFNHCAAGNSKLFLNLFQILLNHLIHGIAAFQNLLIPGNFLQAFLVFLLQRHDFQANQLVKPHFQNGCRLLLCKMELFGVLFKAGVLKLNSGYVSIHQTCLRILQIFGSP